MDDIAQQGACQTRSKAGEPSPPDHALFPGRGPSGDARASGRATIKFTQDDRDRSWRAPNVAPDRGAAGGQPAALPNAGHEVSHDNRKAPPLLTGLLIRNDAAAYLRVAHIYMLISMPTDTSTIFGAFQAIWLSLDTG